MRGFHNSFVTLPRICRVLAFARDVFLCGMLLLSIAVAYVAWAD